MDPNRFIGTKLAHGANVSRIKGNLATRQSTMVKRTSASIIDPGGFLPRSRNRELALVLAAAPLHSVLGSALFGFSRDKMGQENVSLGQ